MTISYTCPHCGKTFDVSDEYAGQSGPCGGCGQTITIPGAAEGVAAPPPEMPQTSSGAAAGAAAGAGAIIAVIAVVCVVGVLACGGVLVALLLPAIQAAREAARRTQCTNNLRQVAIAFHNYHDTYGTFPPAYIPDEDGNPKHSWRVLILPFMEQQALYEMYDFDEPWDSPANMAVTNVGIQAYQCPSSEDVARMPNTTNYMVITGPGTVFQGAEGTKIHDITDGTSNTLLIVEVTGTGVGWAEPVDLDVADLGPPLSAEGPGSTGSRHPGGINAAMCDGSSRFLSDVIDFETFKAMTTRDGGEPINLY
jgi:prepilin-type processing-associated H-X9-DG protein